MLARIQRLAADGRGPRVVFLVALVPLLPALGAGLLADDFMHRAVFLRLGALGGRGAFLDLFRFAPGGEEQRQLTELGVLPWSTPPGLSLVFFRPISVATHWLDFTLWPTQDWMAHLHSLGWFALVVWLATRLFRAEASAGVALLAALFFAADPAHAWPAGWIANRNALIAMAFGLAALLVHRSAREHTRPTRLALSLGLYALGLGAAEAAIGAFGYLAAMELLGERGRLRTRLAWLSPYVVLTVAYRLVYNAHGFGARGSALYLDPAREPLRFAAAATERLPLMVAGGLWGAPIDGWIFLPPWLSHLAAGLGLALMVAALIWLRPAYADRRGRVWLGAMLLSALPFCAAFPTNRLLLWPSLGACLLLARRISMAAEHPQGRLRAAIARLMLWLHLPLAVAGSAITLATLVLFAQIFRVGADGAPHDEALAAQTLVFVNGNDFVTAYTPLTRMVEGAEHRSGRDEVVPRRVAKLAYMDDDVSVVREDARTLRIRPAHGFFHATADRLVYTPDYRLPVGSRVRAADFEVEVLEATEDGRPLAARFRFDEPLDSPRYRFVCFRRGRLEAWNPPATGERATLPATLPALFD